MVSLVHTGIVKNYLLRLLGMVVRLDGDQQHKRESADVLVLTPEVSFPSLSASRITFPHALTNDSNVGRTFTSVSHFHSVSRLLGKVATASGFLPHQSSMDTL